MSANVPKFQTTGFRPFEYALRCDCVDRSRRDRRQPGDDGHGGGELRHRGADPGVPAPHRILHRQERLDEQRSRIEWTNRHRQPDSWRR